MRLIDKMLLVLLAVIAVGLLLFLVAAMHAAALRAHYRHDGPALLPDVRMSPGDVAIRDKSKLCPHADTTARRHVTEAEKKAVCAEYGIVPAKCSGKFLEIDHIVSLELGGSNSIRNLFRSRTNPRRARMRKIVWKIGCTVRCAAARSLWRTRRSRSRSTGTSFID